VGRSLVATMLGLVSVFRSGEAQHVETNTWTDTSTKLSNKEVQTAMRRPTGDQALRQRRRAAKAAAALPPRPSRLGHGGGGLEQLRQQARSQALGRPRFRDLLQGEQQGANALSSS